MQLSKFGHKFTQPSGITQLMHDLGQAFTENHPDLCMLGGGNPAGIPEAQDLFREEMQRLMSSKGFERMIGLYDGPQGEAQFREVLAKYLNHKFDWSLSANNISLTNGSQNSFFYLFNALAGEMQDGSRKRILFPLAPEYVGYADSGLSQNMFCSQTPKIELLEHQQFKYRVDFDALNIDETVAAICLSRPTNPTGNVITDSELSKLRELAKLNGIPLILDNAYGQPFPNVIHTEANLHWDEDIILCMSLSKLGLPGARTGIVIAKQEVTEMISAMSGIITLAPNSVGAALMTRMIEDGEIDHLIHDIIRPFYRSRLEHSIDVFNQRFQDLPVRIHKPEGAFFLWLWCEGLSISASELYQNLKSKQVYVIPGEEFFIDIDRQWRHTQECIRINYAQDPSQLDRGLSILAKELEKLY